MKGILTYNEARNRAEIVFDGKPDGGTRGVLKRAGFWWDGCAGVWHLSRPPVVDPAGRLISDPRKAAIDAVMPVVACDRAAFDRAEDEAAHRAGVRGMEIALGIA
jgi:hypothetical protein